MPNIKLTGDEMRFMFLFESVTNVPVKDCIIDDKLNRIIFIVEPGFVGKAIGRNGINIKRLRKILGKQIEVIEYANEPEKMLQNALFPAKVRGVRITKSADGRTIAIVTVEPKDKGIAIGKNGRNIARARIIAERYFDIENIIIP